MHPALPSSGLLMRIIREIVSPVTCAMPPLDPQIPRCGNVGTHVVSDENLWHEAIFPAAIPFMIDVVKPSSPACSNNTLSPRERLANGINLIVVARVREGKELSFKVGEP